MTQISGSTIFITGCASGIGRALVKHAIQHGAARVIATDVDMKGLGETATQAGALGAGMIETHMLDVANRDAVHELAAQIIADYGAPDIVINNAGVALFAQVAEMTYEDLEWVMDIDFWGMVYGTKAFLNPMIERKRGHIVNVSSIFGMIAVPGNSAYHAAKFGIRGFTESLRSEMTADETNVKVSCVHPGGIKTNVARNARLAQNQELLARKEEITKGFDDFARTTPEEAARVIFTGIEKNNPRILIGADARFMDRIQRLLPVKYQLILGRLFRRNED